VEAGAPALPLLSFLAPTIPARGNRWLLVAVIAAGFRRMFPRMVVEHTRATVCIYGLLCVFFYTGDFLRMQHL
jgi:hypothetical protein